MEPPANNADYREQSYWDHRYTSEESYDWFSAYSSFQHILKSDLQPDHHILTLGCGNSSVSADMYEDGFTHITNTDFSSVVIEKMAEKHAAMTDMSWRVMDMCNLEYSPGSFDIVLEKGTLDALLVHERDPWDTSTETLEKIDSILEQVTRILKPGGKFISITFSQPHFRKPLYARSKYKWDVKLSTFGNSFHFFYFVMEKGKQLSDKDRQNEIERELRRLNDKNASDNNVTLQDNDTDDCLLGIEV